MEYLERPELRRLFEIAYTRNKMHHLALIVGFFNACRVSELLAIDARDVADGQVSIQRSKNGYRTLQPVHVDADVILDCSPLLRLAEEKRGKPKECQLIFRFSRQRVDQFIKRYAELAGIHPDKRHSHAVFRHSLAMSLWDETHSPGQITSFLGHRSASAAMHYLREVDHRRAQTAVAGITL